MINLTNTVYRCSYYVARAGAIAWGMVLLFCLLSVVGGGRWDVADMVFGVFSSRRTTWPFDLTVAIATLIPHRWAHTRPLFHLKLSVLVYGTMSLWWSGTWFLFAHPIHSSTTSRSIFSLYFMAFAALPAATLMLKEYWAPPINHPSRAHLNTHCIYSHAIPN